MSVQAPGNADEASRPAPSVLPAEQPKQRDDDESQAGRLQEFMAAFSQFGPPPNPLADKITSEHITDMLRIERESLSRFQSDRNEERKHQRILAGFACVFVLALVGILVFSNNAALTSNVLSGLIGLAAGAFGGYGYGRSRSE